MEKQLLIDVMPFEVSKEIITESTKNAASGRPFIVKGIIQRAEEKNQNGRVYPRDTLVKEVKNYDEHFIRQRRAMGELDHPASEIVNLKNVSHNIIEVSWDNTTLMGSFEILNTPSGNILRSLFESNIRLGVSSRAMGSLKKISEGVDMVEDDLTLIAFDFVSNPSVKGAFMFPETQHINESVIKNPVTNKWVTVENIIRDIFNEIN